MIVSLHFLNQLIQTVSLTPKTIFLRQKNFSSQGGTIASGLYFFCSFYIVSECENELSPSNFKLDVHLDTVYD